MKKVMVIAEAGVNHNGDINRAIELIDVAASAGADFVKFQTFKAAKLVTKSAAKAEYQKKLTDSSENQFEMLKRLELDRDAHMTLIKHCEKKNIRFLSTPFDEESLHMLVEEMHIPFVKVPSGELTNGPFLLAIARTGLPAVVSTGMATMDEIKEAMGVLAFGYLNSKDAVPTRSAFLKCFNSAEGKKVLQEKVTVLHCTTEYPTPFTDVNLAAMKTMSDALDVPIGYSDHTQGISVSVAAVALGATVIEKHFTTDRNLPGPDHKASLEPNELHEMIRCIREVEQCIGEGLKAPTASEAKNKAAARKSLVAAQDIKNGDKFDLETIVVKRPGTGRSPMDFWDVVNSTSTADYKKDDLIK